MPPALVIWSRLGRQCAGFTGKDPESRHWPRDAGQAPWALGLAFDRVGRTFIHSGAFIRSLLSVIAEFMFSRTILMISFLLIDDHEVLRIGLRFAMEAAFPGARIAEAGSLAQGLARLREAQPRAVLLDAGLPDAAGVAGLQTIRATCPDLSIVMLSGSSDASFINRCLEMGAHGFVPKSVGANEIVACMQLVLAGQIYRPDLDAGGGPSFRETLTPREEEIVMFCAEGLQNKEIGLRLGISDNTVRAHLAKIFKRFDLTSRADTKALVLRLGLEAAVQP